MEPRLIDKALGELQTKSLRTIQIDTAYTWCARACAAAQLAKLEPTVSSSYPSGRVWLEDAIEYGHESIEHAALSNDDSVLADVRQTMAQYGVPL